jgi:hypothetical protein
MESIVCAKAHEFTWTGGYAVLEDPGIPIDSGLEAWSGLTIVHSIGKPTPSKIENVVVADLRKLVISPKNLKGLIGNREI